MALSGQPTVSDRVANTRAILWWIDRQIAEGKSDEQIRRELPVAAAFITGRLGLDDLLAAVRR
jgi:hypothetical protein